MTQQTDKHVSLTVDMGNAAFDDAPATELARILREIAGKIERGEEFAGTIRDSNGNEVGFYDFTG